MTVKTTNTENIEKLVLDWVLNPSNENRKKMWDDGNGIGDYIMPRVVNRNMSRESFIKFINGLEKDILVDIVNEDVENNTTKIEFTPYFGSSIISPMTFEMILSEKEKECINNHNLFVRKLISKNKAKSFIKTRYKIGDILILRGKIKDGSEKNVKEFEVKKVIWSVKSQPVNVLILKQLSGMNTNMSLNKNDCKKYHIKYEPGLQVYSMSLNFNKKKRYEK